MPTLGSIHVLEDVTGRGSGVITPGLIEEAWPSRPRCVEEGGLSRCLLGSVPWVVESLPLGYKSIQGAFQELWREWLRVGRGIGDSSATWSGVCRTFRGFRDPKVPLSTPTGVQLVE